MTIDLSLKIPEFSIFGKHGTDQPTNGQTDPFIEMPVASKNGK